MLPSSLLAELYSEAAVSRVAHRALPGAPVLADAPRGRVRRALARRRAADQSSGRLPGWGG